MVHVVKAGAIGISVIDDMILEVPVDGAVLEVAVEGGETGMIDVDHPRLENMEEVYLNVE